jgi:hypothetical protein
MHEEGEVPTKYQKVKRHLKENRTPYLISVSSISCLVIGGVVGWQLRPEVANELVQKITQLGFRNEANPTIIQLVERSTPSKPVHLVGTDLYFDSLSDAARKTGHHLSQISKQVGGHIPALPNGDVFERLQPMAA